MATIHAWHFCRDDWTLRDGSKLIVGKAYHVDPPIVLCERGLRGSVLAIDALRYGPGPVACRVDLSGEILRDTDKLVATDRRVVAAVDATRVLHEFGYHVATAALLLTDVQDERPWNAIEAKWAWLQGSIGDNELTAARDAARDAAWAAAWAAWDAAWAAGDAAGAAAGDAALAAGAAARAAGDAAWAARCAAWTARDAAWAAGAAARDAAWAAAWDEQNAVLEDMLAEALGSATEGEG